MENNLKRIPGSKRHYIFTVKLNSKRDWHVIRNQSTAREQARNLYLQRRLWVDAGITAWALIVTSEYSFTDLGRMKNGQLQSMAPMA